MPEPEAQDMQRQSLSSTLPAGGSHRTDADAEAERADPATRLWDPLWWAAAGVISIGIVVVLLSVRYLPTNDGPESILSAYVENHYRDPGTIYAQEILPSPQFAAKGFSIVFGPLEALFGWQRALQLTLCVIVLAAFWGYAALVSQLGRGRRWLAIGAVPLAFIWSLYMGFFAFALGQALGLAILALVLRGRPSGARAKLLVAALLLLQSVCHVFSAVLTAATVASVFLFQGRRRLGHALLGTAAVCSPVVAVVLAASWDQATSARVAFQAQTQWLPWSTWAEELPRLLVPGPLWRAVVVLAVVAAATGAVFVRTARRSLSEIEKPLALSAISFLAAGSLLPFHLAGWQFLSPRFLPTGALLAISLLPIERLKPRAAAPVLATLVGLGSLVVTYRFDKHLEAAFSDVLAAIDAPTSRKKIQLPVVLDPWDGLSRVPGHQEVPHLALNVHAGALFAVAHGGLVPYMFLGTSASHAFKVRPDSPGTRTVPPLEHYGAIALSPQFRTDPALRRQTIAELLLYGTEYDSVVVLGARDEDVQQFLSRGYVSEFRDGSVLLATFRGCEAEVEASAADVQQGLRVEMSLPEMGEPFLNTARLDWQQRADGTLSCRLYHLPCGKAQLRLLARRPTRCEGGAPHAGLLLDLRPGRLTQARCAGEP